MDNDNRQPPGAQPQNDTSAKSKGKATDNGSGNSDSITSRLQASGRLALHAFGTGPDISGQRPDEKASSSGSSITGRNSSSTGDASSHRLRSTAHGESLRSQTNLVSGASAEAFDAFFSADATLEVEDASQYGRLPNQSHHIPSTPSAVLEQEKMDGAAVVNLLDDSSGGLDGVLLGAHDPDAEDEGLTPEAAAKLRETLFPADSVFSGFRWDDLLNFNPEFLDQAGPEADFERQLHFGTTSADEVRNSYLEQWDKVLNGYTEYVWGGLEPLIAEARREVEEVKTQGLDAVPQTKALDRLRQILGHVRGF
ncbi:hypothetical protein FOXG_00007 [Fusarium oxysporum f. sp. lycopersici 4287]|uniref:Uncharacterized protein n=3 Tax=Fusarium oxysporum TaxID=5507 RepID=A0A0J9U3J8_FUSO4|nr:hypothetical protein FOXG_00007 [Fusarium oxysporum f. sp. lycopersici 4287]EXK47092.1 hypothetical protein FOMG_00641 [Fusarium oxysporum f. sp. melonis 26406]KAJ9429315.1 hypothetical protein QL093DRAFT_2158973 [Fusarium oxysporum]KNA93494.1 hypothetical protein FOXG_00007 [Fusarium oxysporum f. sp. lycopersici 4287]